jgi:hypothetical protein
MVRLPIPPSHDPPADPPMLFASLPLIVPAAFIETAPQRGDLPIAHSLFIKVVISSERKIDERQRSSTRPKAANR